MTDPASRSSAPLVERLVADTLRPAVRDLAAYHVPPARDVVKLDAMESPYPMPEGLRSEWLEALGGVALNRYPDAAATALKEELRAAYDIPADAGILLGNGSDEIIQIVETAAAGPVLAPAPSFVMYEMMARYLEREYIQVPLGEGFELDPDAMNAAIRRHRPAVVFLAWPNNPTGNLFDEADLRGVIESAPGLVVVDEAYHAFAARTMMGGLTEYPNLMVMRTLSKVGLAGLRFGFAAADPAWVRELDKIRMPYNTSALTQASVRFALAHLDAFRQQAETIRSQRGRVLEALSAAGYHCFPSDTNFILFRCDGRQADEVFDSLLEAGVLIKNLHGAHPSLAGCLRVSVGTPEENDRFLDALPR